MNYIDDLRLRIKDKFGTKSRFCKIAGLNPVDVDKLFSMYLRNPTEERFRKLQEISLKLDLLEGNPINEISQDERAFVQKSINDNFKNLHRFVIACGVNYKTVYKILSGDMVKKNKTFNKVMTFCKKLDADSAGRFQREKMLRLDKMKVRKWMIGGFYKSKKPKVNFEDLKKFIGESEEMNEEFLKSRVHCLESIEI